MGRETTFTQVLQNAVGSNGNGAVFDASGLADVALQVSGAFTATVNFEGSNDGANWAAVALYNSAGAAVSTAAAPGMFNSPFVGVGYLLLRARVSGWASGNMTVVAAGHS